MTKVCWFLMRLSDTHVMPCKYLDLINTRIDTWISYGNTTIIDSCLQCVVSLNMTMHCICVFFILIKTFFIGSTCPKWLHLGYEIQCIHLTDCDEFTCYLPTFKTINNCITPLYKQTLYDTYVPCHYCDASIEIVAGHMLHFRLLSKQCRL